MFFRKDLNTTPASVAQSINYRKAFNFLQAKIMPNYTLHYFNSTGRAEIARLIFHYAGVQFTDHRFEFSEWPELKKDSEC